MSNGRPESGDHHQNAFSTTTYYVDDAFSPFGIDGGDIQQFLNVGNYSTNDEISSYNNYSSPSDYQTLPPPPEINSQYLKELETDKIFLQSLCQAMSPPYFYHAAKLLDDEIARVESILSRDLAVLSEENLPFNNDLPIPEGDVTTVEEKVVVPVDTNPEYNFIGRLMGPRGMTIKRMEQETGCRLLVRGKGSIKNAIKEESLRRKPGFEHLNEGLHILVQAKDAENRVNVKLSRGVEAVKQMLTPVENDHLKQRQMRELAIINGTYRPVQHVGHQATTTLASAYEQLQNMY